MNTAVTICSAFTDSGSCAAATDIVASLQGAGGKGSGSGGGGGDGGGSATTITTSFCLLAVGTVVAVAFGNVARFRV